MNEKVNLREDIEWSNTWISKANRDVQRCLLIGDSVTRDIRSVLEKFVGEWLAIDFFGGSYDINDSLFWNHLYCFFKSDYKYKTIILNYGFHHGKSIIKSESQIEFKNSYTKLLRVCLQNSQYVVFMSGTSWNENSEEYKKNEEIVIKNQILSNLARKDHCIFMDLESTMNNFPYKYTDHVHFEERANAFISVEIIKKIFNNLFEMEWSKFQKKKEREIYGKYPELNYKKNIYIYGKGKKGNMLYFLLKTFIQNFKMLGWCVSEKEEESYLGIQVFSINNIPTKDLLIIPSGIYEKEMLENARILGHNNILIYDMD